LSGPDEQEHRQRMTLKKRKSQGRSARTRTKIGFALVGIAVILLICYSYVTISTTGVPRLRLKTFLPLAFWRYIIFPIFHLLGLAAYLLPFVLMAAGAFQWWEYFYLRRRRKIIRLVLSLPLFAAFITGCGTLFHWPTRQGGLIGSYFFEVLTKIAGSFLGWIVGMGVVLALSVSLWGAGSIVRKSIRWASSGIRTALKRSKINKQAPVTIQRGQTWMDQGPKREFSSDSFSPENDGGFGQSRAPWEQQENGVKDDDESTFRPYPANEETEPLPKEMLPDPPPLSPDRRRVCEELQAIQQKIVEVIHRTSNIRLVGAALPLLGLNSIAFVFNREGGQTIPVGQVEKALKDIGIETGRAPAKLDIGATVRIELPLHRLERAFAPIKFLLMETMPPSADGLKINYLIGRYQNGDPYDLEIAEAKHILVGGGTGGGKSVLLHSIIFGVIFRYAPTRVQLCLVDHKVIEFSYYRGLPHLWQGIVTTQPGFSRLIENLSAELQRRKLALAKDVDADFPILLTIIDEFAGSDSRALVRLIAEARALKMFFILATQHPTRENISTSIKANLMTGIAFRTKEQSGSQLIVGNSDAVALQGRGDALVFSEASGLSRVQVGWVTSPRDGENSDLLALSQYLKTRNSNSSFPS